MSKKRPSVCIVNSNPQYERMFINMGWSVTKPSVGFSGIFNSDLIQFTGGEDVTPSIYGEENTSSHNNFSRDFTEAGIFAIAKRLGKPMAGICRGGQFLNVMCGGKMEQHVDGHATGGTHEIHETRRGIVKIQQPRVINVTSTHHQMMVGGPDSGLVAYARLNASKVFEFDTEVLVYSTMAGYYALCFQPHPEFDGYDECRDYYFELVDKYFGLKS